MTDRERTCAERINGQLRGRLEDFERIGKRIQESYEPGVDADEIDDASEEQYGYPLGVSEQRVVRVDLSTGGPGDWFECFMDAGEESGYPVRIVYHFVDWFDHAERTLEGDEYEVAADFLRPFLGVE